MLNIGRHRVGAVTLAALLVASIASGCTPTLTSGAEGVYVANPDGSDVVKVASEPVRAAWSPDGTRLAYAASDGVWTVGADGTAATRINDTREAGAPSWSPAGDRVAFVDPSRNELVVQEVAGGDPTRFPMLAPGVPGAAATFASDNVPTWSPDGREIAFLSWDGNGDEVFALSLATGALTQVSSIRVSGEAVNPEVPGSPRKAQSNASSPRWSPTDQDSIAFALLPETSGSPGGVYVGSPTGGRERRLVGITPVWGPAWSQDGAHLLFASAKDDQSDLYMGRPDRFGATNLTARWPVLVQSASSSPDGTEIVVAADDDLYRLDRATDELAPIVTGPDRESWPAWSPTGGKIVFTRSLKLIDSR